MTTASTPVFTNKETVFRDLLVPAGVLAEIMIAALPDHSTKGSPTRAKYAYRLFHTLNLASCYALNPENRDLSALQVALSAFIVTMTRGMGQGTRRSIATATSVSEFRHILPEAVRVSLAEELAANLVSIQTSIGYDPSKAQAWRQAQTRIATPLTRDGRINRWRTFVRNTEWAQCMGTLGFAPSQLEPNPFSSRVGIEKMPALWRETFSHIVRPAYTEPTEKEALHAEAESSAAPVGPATAASSSHASETFRLPIGVTVNSTSDGQLCVQGTFDPAAFLTSKQLQEMKKGPTSATTELRAVLAVRKFEQLCEFPALAATLEAVRVWRAAQDAGRPAVQHAFGNWRLAELEKGVTAKLRTHFNAEERRILFKLLIAEQPSATPATPDAA